MPAGFLPLAAVVDAQKESAFRGNRKFAKGGSLPPNIARKRSAFNCARMMQRYFLTSQIHGRYTGWRHCCRLCYGLRNTSATNQRPSREERKTAKGGSLSAGGIHVDVSPGIEDVTNI
jgi:hypothetical protein